MKVLLIIPCYNEEKNIKKVYDKIVSFNAHNPEKYDFVFVNDGSKDKTEEELRKNKINNIRLIKNLGIGGAVQTGYKYAFENNYDVAVQMDGDGQHDINFVKTIVEPIEKGEANFVIGSRFIDKNSSVFKSSFLRRFGIKLISLVIKIKTKAKVYDTTSGFRAVDKNIIKEFSESYPVEYPEPISTVFCLQKGYKVSERPVAMHEREEGESSIKAWNNVYYMINVILSIFFMKKKDR